MAVTEKHQGDMISGRRIDLENYGIDFKISFYFVSHQTNYMSKVRKDFNNARWIWITTRYNEDNGKTKYYFYTERYRLDCAYQYDYKKNKYDKSYFIVLGVSEKKAEDRLRSVKYGLKLFHRGKYGFYEGQKYNIPDHRKTLIIKAEIDKTAKKLSNYKETYNQDKEKEVEKDMEELEQIRNWGEELKELIDLQDDFERQNAKQKAFVYSKFEEISSNKVVGVEYKFYIEDTNIEYESSLKYSKLNVTETIGEETDISGIVKDYSAEEQYIILSFQDTVDWGKIPKSGFLLDMQNNITYKIQKKAIESLIDGRSINRHLLNILIKKKYKKIGKKGSYNIFTDVENKPTKSQLEAVKLAINAEDFLLVQGPPGTGKTTIIVEMVKEFVKQNKRVLISSKNNLAVDNVLENCIRGDISCVRLGKEEKVKIDIVKERILDRAAVTLQKEVLERCDREELKIIKEREQNSKLVDILRDKNDDFLDYYSLNKRAKKYFEKMSKRKRKIKRRYFYKRIPVNLIKVLSIFSKRKVLLKKKEEQYQSFVSEKILSDKKHIKIEENYKKLSEKKELKESKIDNLLEDFKDYIKFDYKILREDEFENEIKKEKELTKVLSNRSLILDNWKKSLDERQQSLYPLLLNSVMVVGATCIGVNTNFKFKDVDFDVAIVDEAGQITIFDEIVPMSRARKVILVGDHMQLPPVPNNDFLNALKDENISDEDSYYSEDDYNELLEKSLFELLFESCPEENRVMLDTQFRMHPTIAKFISNEFYEGKYITGLPAEKRELEISIFDRPLYFIDTKNLGVHKFENFEIPDDHKLYFNKTEAKIASNILVNLIKDGADPAEIGVITPYRRQKEEIERFLNRYLEGETDANKILNKIEIDTVDSFQGRDKNIILFSFTRSNDDNSIGFLSELRRLNVTMTRAKYLLIMIGDSETLRKTKNYKARNCFSSLIKYVEKNKGYLHWSDIKNNLWLGGDINE
ncbi:MAG: DEAD/DEAH box helicase [Halanaerobiales bacterium]